MAKFGPVIVVEILSPSSIHMDTSAKLIGYFKLESVRHYFVIDPDARTVTHHRRVSGNRILTDTVMTGTLRLDVPDITIDIGALLG